MDIRTGSHNVVVGQSHNFSRFGGLVVGRFNTISGEFASVSGGATGQRLRPRSAGVRNGSGGCPRLVVGGIFPFVTSAGLRNRAMGAFR